MSEALRYARILNGFSFLISSRSAISCRIRAIAWLSNLKSARFDAVLEDTSPSDGEGFGNPRARRRRTVAEEAAAAPGAADFGGSGSGCRRARHQVVYRRRRDAGRQRFAVVPFGGDLAADLVPVAADQGRPHRDGRIADALEAVENPSIAVEMALRDLPVVRARLPRLTGI